MKTPFDAMGATLPCRCFPDFPDMCACADGEVALRHYSSQPGSPDPGAETVPPMTPDQQNWCLDEIGLGSEYGLERSEYEQKPDRDLAKGVINVWAEFCRDKGLI